jgi:hypothetical protein
MMNWGGVGIGSIQECAADRNKGDVKKKTEGKIDFR